MIAGVLAADAILGGTRRGRGLRVAAAVAMPFVVGALGQLRLAQIDEEQAAAPTVRVGIVQPNVALASPFDGDKMAQGTAAAYAAFAKENKA